MKPNNQILATAYAFAAILLWSSVASAFKLTLQHLRPEQMLQIASLLSFFIFFIVFTIQKGWSRLLSLDKKSILFLGFSGFLNPFIYYLLLFNAYDRLPAQIAQPLNYTWPLILSFLISLFYGKVLNHFEWIGLTIGLLGVILVSTGGQFVRFSDLNIPGVLIALASSLVWAIYWLINIKSSIDLVLKLLISNFTGFLLISLYNVISGISIPVSTPGLAGAAYIGAFEMGITFLLWLKALTTATNQTNITMLANVTPVLSLILIAILLNETIHWSTLVGLFLILSGIIIQRRQQKH